MRHHHLGVGLSVSARFRPVVVICGVLATGCSASSASPTATVTPPLAQDSARFAAAAAYSDSTAGDGILVLRDGAVVFERYVSPTTANTFHMLASGTKSFTCALYALGAAKGYWTLETPASDIISEWRGIPRKQDIRVRQLLSLSSGLSEAPAYSARTVTDLDTYSLGIQDAPATYAPDSAAIYTPTTFQVFAAMLERKNGGEDPVGFLERELLTPLGIASDQTHPLASRWTRDARGKPQMAGGAYLTAREWSRYGEVILNAGQWNGAPLLSSARVTECLQYRPPAFLGYGLTWWLNRPNEGSYRSPPDQLPSDGLGDVTQIASNAPADMIMAAGTGKQRLYVIPSLRLVIVRFGRVAGSTQEFNDHAFFSRLLGTP